MRKRSIYAAAANMLDEIDAVRMSLTRYINNFEVTNDKQAALVKQLNEQLYELNVYHALLSEIGK